MATKQITDKRRLHGGYLVMLIIATGLSVIVPLDAQQIGRDPPGPVGRAVVGRARALAAPTGENALELDGEKKSFFKVGGFRDGVQKAIFDETQGAPVSPDFDEQPARPAAFSNAYDDNSIVDTRSEVPLWVPPIYRNETEEEKTTTAATSRPTSPPTTRTLRPLVATGLSNRAPIPVRTTPTPSLRPVQPFSSQQPRVQPPKQQQFQVQQQLQTLPQQSTQQPVPPEQAQQPFMPQLPVPQPPVPEQTVPPQQFVPQQSQQPVPQPAAPQQFVPEPPAPQQPGPFVPQQPQQPVQRPVSRPKPVLSTNFPTQTAAQQQQQQLRRPFNQQQPAPRRPAQSRPVGSDPQPLPVQQPQNPRPLRPFQPQQNNFANQKPRNPAALRTGVCHNTIFYQTVLAAPFELQQVYSHFAVVVSVDQCARTCHEFNCATAFLDPQSKHCQFNPSTSFATSEGTCPQWPNPLYRNNIAIGSQAYKISCVTCQRRRRNNRPLQGQQSSNLVANRFFNGQQAPQFNGINRRPAPIVFQTTNHNRLNNQNSFQRLSNAAARGVLIEHQQPKTAIVDDHFGRERLEPSEADWKSLEELESSDPGASRTTILPPTPLFSSLRIQPLKKGLIFSPPEEAVPKEELPQLDSSTNFKLRDQETVSVEEERSAPLLGKTALRNTKGVTTNRQSAEGGGESRLLVEIPTN